MRRLLLATVLALAACAPLKVEHRVVPGVDVAGYRTFSWAAEPALISVTPQVVPTERVEALIKASVREVLEDKGYRFEPQREAADMLLSFTLGDRTQMAVTQREFEAGLGWTDASMTDYRQGRLAVDVVERQSRKAVWHGYATRSIRARDQANLARTIHQVARAILGVFPDAS